MAKSVTQQMRKLFFWILVVVVLDQLTKFYIQYLGISLIINYGISFGVATEIDNGLLIIILSTFFLSMALIGRRWWSENPFAGGLFLGGALANLLDRYFLGGVRDWLFIPILDVYNNFADIALFIGVFLIIYQLSVDDKKFVKK